MSLTHKVLDLPKNLPGANTLAYSDAQLVTDKWFMSLTHKCQTSLKKLPGTNTLAYFCAQLETDKLFYEPYTQVLDQPEKKLAGAKRSSLFWHTFRYIIL